MLASLFALLPYLALISASPIAKRQVAGSVIISGRASDQCLSVEGGAKAVAEGKLTNGTPVITVACAKASLWDIKEGSGSVVVTGTDFALDIGLEPGNHGALKVWDWKSFPTVPQQTWYLTGDQRIAQTGGDQCLDQGDDGVQTYACTPDNSNQVWNVGSTGATSTAAVVVPTTVATGAYGSDATGVAAPVVTTATGGPGGAGATETISPIATSSIGDVSGPDATGAATSSIGNLGGSEATGAVTIGDVTGPNATAAYAVIAEAAATVGSTGQDSTIALEAEAPATTMINPNGAEATSIASLVGDFTVFTRYAGSKPTGGDGNTGAAKPTTTLSAGGPNTTGDSSSGPATAA